MRTRHLLLLLFLLLFSRAADAQETFDAGIIAEHCQLSDRNMRSFGVQLCFPVADRYTLNYHFGIGPSSLKGFYVHSTAGMVGGVYLISKFDSTQIGHKVMGVIGFFSMFVPEGVGYYINPEGKWKVHVLANPLGYDYWKRKKDTYYEEGRMCGDLVFRFKHSIDDLMYIAPHIGCKYIYRGGRLGGTIGFTLGFNLKED